ncbi:uncharacterized protein LOC117343020 [Pecten maximus]|uniref:uncharacterized protein LOC117343020 n=1 Tax=Pecten maximus TaxID=6579 RepID=UPI0014591658|nr:uncharacterized protein LOC117343020 [Pecten maximus]
MVPIRKPVAGYLILCLSVFYVVNMGVVSGHGRLVKPPGRSTMWRYGYNTPPNYNDHQLFCGGFPVQWWMNGGKCGICGDRYDVPIRDNEPPYGRFANGVITGYYQKGGVIDINVEVTASHKGYFEFRLCPNNNVKRAATQSCLDRYLLQEYYGNSTQVFVSDKSVGLYDIKMRLPYDVTCSQCVLQWRYRSGNRWGCTGNDFTRGSCGLGRGPQEEFYACSDIAILESGTDDNAIPSPTTHYPNVPTSLTTKAPPVQTTRTVQTTTVPSTTQAPTQRPVTRIPPPSIQIVCKSAGAWKGLLAMDKWCDVNCKRRYCPMTHCRCSPAGQLVDDQDYGLLGTGKNCFSVAGIPGLDLWCQHNCPQGLCDQNTCYCT